MILLESELKAAAELVAKAEADLGTLSQGQITDLIADNRCDEHCNWELAKCQQVAASLCSGWGVGAFHMAEARTAINQPPAKATTLSHGNFALHRLLTDQGACVHQHYADSFEDTGDAESGPCLEGGPAYDEYRSESHYMIVDASGDIVHQSLIDWDMERFVDQMTSSGVDEYDIDQYVPQRRTGEDFTVKYRDEDGNWFEQRGSCWTSDPRESHPLTRSEAEQRAHAFNTASHDRIVGRASIIDYPDVGKSRRT
jgi:hypothetical protein